MKKWNTLAEADISWMKAVKQRDDKDNYRVIMKDTKDGIETHKVYYEGRSYYAATMAYNQILNPLASKKMQDAVEAYDSVMNCWPRSVERREHAHAAALATALTAILKGE